MGLNNNVKGLLQNNLGVVVTGRAGGCGYRWNYWLRLDNCWKWVTASLELIPYCPLLCICVKFCIKKVFKIKRHITIVQWIMRWAVKGFVLKYIDRQIQILCSTGNLTQHCFISLASDDFSENICWTSK